VSVTGVLLSGAAATIVSSADAPLGSGHRVEVYGEAGALVLENATADHARGFRLLAGTRASGRLEPVAVEEEGAAGADGRIGVTARLAHRFLDAIETGAPARPGLAEGLRVQRLLDATRRSSEAGGGEVEVAP
jgi:predicted dehydrogenase